jgi:hypothetical protein
LLFRDMGLMSTSSRFEIVLEEAAAVAHLLLMAALSIQWLRRATTYATSSSSLHFTLEVVLLPIA